MMIVDINVASAIMASRRDPRFDAWLNATDELGLWLPSIAAMELKAGIDSLDDGRRKSELDAAFEKLLAVAFPSRILSFDLADAKATASIGARRKRPGRPAGYADTLLAGMAVARSATFVTRNVKHFADLSIKIINPWTA